MAGIASWESSSPSTAHDGAKWPSSANVHASPTSTAGEPEHAKAVDLKLLIGAPASGCRRVPSQAARLFG